VEADPQALMAASQGTTFCRIWLSTFNGMGNLFHKFAHDTKSPMRRIETFWWNNPDRAQGMYTSKQGEIVIIDKFYKWPSEPYEFIADGLLRSPFFDYELSRAGANIQSMLEELNGVAAAKTRKLYQGDYVTTLENGIIRPTWKGTLTMDGEWIEDTDGEWRLWRAPDRLDGEIFIGIDPSSGIITGAYSAMSGIDAETGELVFSYAGHLPPIECARLANVAGKRFSTPGRYAVINVETTGSLNATFVNELVRLRYPRIHTDASNRIGYRNNDRGQAILAEIGRAARDGELLIYDQRIVDELLFFEFDRDGNLVWGGDDGHADRAISCAIAWDAAKTRRKAVLKAAEQARKILSSGPDAEPEWQNHVRQIEGQWSARFRHL
jgi:hypothetical protein